MDRLPTSEELPFRFVPPRPSRLWSWALYPFRHHFLHRINRVRSIVFQEEEHVQRLWRQGGRILLAPNHCDRADTLVLFRLADTMKTVFCCLATYQIFVGNAGLRYHLFPRLGYFPIDRQGMQGDAIKAARRVLTDSANPLLIFPEAEIYNTSDRLHPLRHGASSIALSAQQALSEGQVWIVPVAIKYRYIDPQATLKVLSARLAALEARFTWQPHLGEGLLERLHRFGHALVAFKEVAYLGAARRGPLPKRLDHLCETILQRIEASQNRRWVDKSMPERINEARRHCIKQLKTQTLAAQDASACRRELDDLFFVLQLYCYSCDYVAELPTVERIAETIIKLEQDLAGVMEVAQPGDRQAAVRFGEPIAVAEFAWSDNRRSAIQHCTALLEQRIRTEMDTLGFGSVGV